MTKRKLKLMLHKKYIRGLIVFALCSLIILCAAIPTVKHYIRFSSKEPIALSDIFIKKTDRVKINLTAQRGLASQAPENTMPAIEQASRKGFRSVELDLRLTKDGVWVLSADSRVDLTTDGFGKVSSYTYYDLITCKVNRGANCKNYNELTIPSLEQALKACLEYNAKPILNLLDYSDNSLEALIEIIEENGFTESCRVMCESEETLKKINELNPNIQTVIYIDRLTSGKVKKVLSSSQDEICINSKYNLHSGKNITKLIDNGKKLYCMGVSDAEKMQKYFELGICNFITDRIYK